jgi:mannose-6-phosphate isomerase-like protein (cupin superfamily)
MPHLVRNIQEAEPKQITCGLMRKLSTPNDFKGMDIIHVTITDSTKRHYHKKLTEVYYILKGSMDMEVDGKIEHLEKGNMIMIFPGTNHKAWKTSKENAEVLVVCCPPWTDEDEILVE